MSNPEVDGSKRAIVPPDLEPEPQWYSSTASRFFGNLRVEVTAGVLYAALASLPIVFVARGCNFKAMVTTHGHTTALLGLWALVVSLGYPLWAWLETSAFEKWVRSRPAAQRVVERAYFKSIGDCTRNFWAAVIAVYAIAGLWTNASAVSQNSPPPQQSQRTSHGICP
jgi:hypothetical protein